MCMHACLEVSYKFAENDLNVANIHHVPACMTSYLTPLTVWT